MTDPVAEYSKEIREYLLGRIRKHTTTGAIQKPKMPDSIPPAPVCRWWMFEGKRYVGLEHSLAKSWPQIGIAIQMLLKTFNPRWQILEVPEGRVDWSRTIMENIGLMSPVFVCDTSSLGLNEDEKLALKAWLNWIVKEWNLYINHVGNPVGSEPIGQILEGLSEFNYQSNIYPLSQFRRFANTAKRSRWPFLRNIVAESFRCFLEIEELDKLPLPSEREYIYELFCLVCVLKCFNSRPDSIRWLSADNGNNEIDIPGIYCKCQHSFSRQKMLASSEFNGPLAIAMDAFKVGVPKFPDIILRFDKARNGFDAILIEVKSGNQNFDAAVYQLKAYRAALSEQNIGKLLVWGIVEGKNDISDVSHLKDYIRKASGREENEIWVFTGHKEIPYILDYTGIV